MSTISLGSWNEFEARLDGYMDLPASRRQQLIFRGQSSTDWPLCPTIDRVDRPSTISRDEAIEILIREFERQCLGLEVSLSKPSSPREWELLGRHHGMPTSILDWTTSPFVAAFFAFADTNQDTESVVIYCFDRLYFEQASTGEDPIQIWDDPSDYRSNLRAIEQGAVFMKTFEIGRPLELALAPFLWRYTIPGTERHRAMAKLAEMRISYRQLFRDLDHAAKSAIWQAVESRAAE